MIFSSQASGVQCLSGTGALCIGANFLKKYYNTRKPDTDVYHKHVYQTGGNAVEFNDDVGSEVQLEQHAYSFSVRYISFNCA